MNRKVSVIIPAYNAEKTIERCLNSLLIQTLKGIEIIVVDDASLDNTREILDCFKNKIITIYNDENLGPAASRNKALKIAKGEYIGFIDADDYVDPKMYEKMVNAMEEDVDLVCCSRVNETKDLSHVITNEHETDNPKEFTKTSNYIWDKLFKKSIIDQYKIVFPEDYSYAEDFAFLIQYKFYANKMKILKDPLYYYQYDSENSITNSYKANLLHIIDVLEETLDFFREKNAFDDYEDELLNLSIGFYVRRIKEFKKYDDLKLQKMFVKRFLHYFEENFKDYKEKINTYKTNKNQICRTSYPLMILYIWKQQRKRIAKK